MNQLYQAEGISKQAVHQQSRRRQRQAERVQELLPAVKRWRSGNGGVSVRVFHREFKPSGVGRDRFERWCFAHGLRVKRIRNAFRTTVSGPQLPFENKLPGLELTGINQVWVSDITYYPLPAKTAYITLIMDLLSRFIVGYHVSTRLLTEQTTIPALRAALEKRRPPQGLILHSDGGGQYFDQSFIELTKANLVENSMGRGVYENAHAERLNQTLKNQFIVYDHPQTLAELCKSVDRVIYKYNYERKHQALGLQTPARYEAQNPIPSKKIVAKTFKMHQYALVLM